LDRTSRELRRRSHFCLTGRWLHGGSGNSSEAEHRLDKLKREEAMDKNIA
jgi:hypothetical protein